jgi:hypothetical protein
MDVRNRNSQHFGRLGHFEWNWMLLMELILILDFHFDETFVDLEKFVRKKLMVRVSLSLLLATDIERS